MSIELEKNAALEDLDATIKKSQNQLIGTIVKSALFVIMSVGFITTIMYSFAILSNKDTQIIGSTWSNMFSVLLTNAFSITNSPGLETEPSIRPAASHMALVSCNISIEPQIMTRSSAGFNGLRGCLV